MKGRIKEITDVEEFKRVYKVFEGKPYEELYTPEEVEEFFEDYRKNGWILGAYTSEGCVGLISLQRGVEKDQPVDFGDEKVLYLADVAVLEPYRKMGLGRMLMSLAVLSAKGLGCDRLYMRTLKEGSMSKGIAEKLGFKQIQGLIQYVKRKRIDGTTTAKPNIFLDLDVNNLDERSLRECMKVVKPSRETIREIR